MCRKKKKILPLRLLEGTRRAKVSSRWLSQSTRGKQGADRLCTSRGSKREEGSELRSLSPGLKTKSLGRGEAYSAGRESELQQSPAHPINGARAERGGACRIGAGGTVIYL